MKNFAFVDRTTNGLFIGNDASEDIWTINPEQAMQFEFITAAIGAATLKGLGLNDYTVEPVVKYRTTRQGAFDRIDDYRE